MLYLFYVMSLGHNIKHYRTLLGLSQAEVLNEVRKIVGSKYKLPHNYLSKIETGQRSPGGELVQAIARTLGVKTESLYDDPPQKKRPTSKSPREFDEVQLPKGLREFMNTHEWNQAHVTPEEFSVLQSLDPATTVRADQKWFAEFLQLLRKIPKK